MTANEPSVPDVPTQVFQEFLRSLATQGIPKEVIESLRHTMVDERDLSERALREAISPESSL